MKNATILLGTLPGIDPAILVQHSNQLSLTEFSCRFLTLLELEFCFITLIRPSNLVLENQKRERILWYVLPY
jgi:hypothetical protein